MKRLLSVLVTLSPLMSMANVPEFKPLVFCVCGDIRGAFNNSLGYGLLISSRTPFYRNGQFVEYGDSQEVTRIFTKDLQECLANIQVNPTCPKQEEK